MSAFIHTLATRVPQYAHSQAHTRDRLKSWSSDTRTRRLIHAAHNHSGIDTRHSVLPDFQDGVAPALYRPEADGRLVSPGTAARNDCYAQAAPRLAVDTARQALGEGGSFRASEVTHVIYVSCTGFANPGPDFHLIRELGLPATVQRYTLGFMGCYAALPALRMAAQFCEADADAVVLVVCTELCTLHMRMDDRPDSVLANALFADGAASAVVSARTPPPGAAAYRLEGFASALLPTGEAAMAWDIRDDGFAITLSSYVPDLLAGDLRERIAGTLAARGLQFREVDEWAVHPGGRAILDRVEDSLGLERNGLRASRNVLRDYGNMSSATLLFVLKELLDEAENAPALTCAMAFGPGLTLETALLERLGCTVPQASQHLAEKRRHALQPS